MKIIICGICGKMGENLLNLLENDGAEVVCGVDISSSEKVDVPVYKSFEEIRGSAEVIIDFSSPSVLKSEMVWAIKRNIPVVLAVTGYSNEQLEYIDECAKKIPVFRTANFSLGVNLLVKLVRKTAEALGESFDIEIIEKHHNKKADAPSGTALMLAEGANSAFENRKSYLNGREGAVGRRGSEIGIHAVRGGTIVGEHEVLFAGGDEIITLSHSARSKKVFASGAIKAAKWIVGKPAGKYDMTDILENL